MRTSLDKLPLINRLNRKNLKSPLPPPYHGVSEGLLSGASSKMLPSCTAKGSTVVSEDRKNLMVGVTAVDATITSQAPQSLLKDDGTNIELIGCGCGTGRGVAGRGRAGPGRRA